MNDTIPMPPLNALRAFGAVGRHLSFTAAGQELHVTPAAISQQIKNLEAILGVALFHRTGRETKLTEYGEILLPGIEKGFKELETAIRICKAHGNSSYISCNTVGAFAARWLVPRLPRWTLSNPEIDVRISTTSEIVKFDRQEIDLAIRLTNGREVGLFTELLQIETVVPLCSPSLLGHTQPLGRPNDLIYHQLIHFTPPNGNINTRWTDWLSIAGVTNVDTNRGFFFSDAMAALNAAIAGQGVVLAPKTIATDDLETGNLIVPFEIELPTDLAWYIIAPPENIVRDEILAFKEWLLSEANGGQASQE